jgi:hypothetical protein
MRKGQETEASELLDGYIDPETPDRLATWSTWGDSFSAAAAHAALGQNERALDRLALAIREGFRNSRWLAIDPMFESVREEPRYGRLTAELEHLVEKERLRARHGDSGRGIGRFGR